MARPDVSDMERSTVDLTQNVWLKTGTVVSILTALAGATAYVGILPPAWQPFAFFAIAVAGAALKLFNPADSKIEG
jgi:hypothetical protein